MLLPALLTCTLLAHAEPRPLASPPPAGEPIWVFLGEREAANGEVSAELERLLRAGELPLTDRALQRRAARRTVPGLIDLHDLPVSEAALSAIRSTGATVRTTSRWLNAVSVMANGTERRAIESLPMVASTQPVRRAARPVLVEGPAPQAPASGGASGGGSGDGIAGISPYGIALSQLEQINLVALHDRGFTGAGVVIGILDTGFNRVHAAFNHPEHPLEVIAEWDFINGDPNTAIERGDNSQQHRHGTWILSAIGGYEPSEYIGAAPDASFILAKTEDVVSETPIEEDYYVAGLEFIEANGGDLATSSLGYFDWYLPEDFDGQTAVTTIAVNIATANGLVCLTAAGNAGHDEDPSTHHLGAPADAFEVITCGAVTDEGATADFSSDGPTVDGRVKPELLARGVATAVTHSTNATGYAGVSGTSLSTPLVAGAVACILQARPDLTVTALRSNLFATASDTLAGTAPDPLFIRGYGLIRANLASIEGLPPADLDWNGTVDGADLGGLLAQWGSCDECTECPADLTGDCAVDGADLGELLSAWGGG